LFHRHSLAIDSGARLACDSLMDLIMLALT